MKRLFLALTCCVMAVSASAQKITEQQLLGKWEISFVNIEGTTIDFETEAITLAPDATEDEGLAEDDIRARIKKSMGTKSDSYVLFSEGSQWLMSINGQEDVSGQYTISENGGQQFITHAGIKHKADLTDGKLTLVLPARGGTEIEIRFNKV